MSEDMARKPYVVCGRYSKIWDLIDQEFHRVFIKGDKEDLLELVRYIDEIEPCVWLDLYNDEQIPFNVFIMIDKIRVSAVDSGCILFRLVDSGVEWVFGNGIVINHATNHAVLCSIDGCFCRRFSLYKK